MKKVFLSSTATEMKEFREAVREALDKEGLVCVRQEDFNASDLAPIEYCRERIKGCDLFIGLLGPCYGSSPPDETLSFTEFEYMAAKKLGIKTLMFLTDEDLKISAKFLLSDKRLEEQEAFRKKVQLTETRRIFRTPDDLKFQVMSAIHALNKEPECYPVDCIILCGGSASRLSPLTRDFCKELLPVAGKKALDYTLDMLQGCPLARNIFLVTGGRFKDQLSAHIAERAAQPVSVIVEPPKADGSKAGPIGALAHIAKLHGLRDYLIIGGDNLFDGFNIVDFIRFAQGKRTSANVFYRIDTGCNGDLVEYGIAELKADETVERFREKQLIPSFLNISTACYYLRKNEVEAFGDYLANGCDSNSLGGLIQWLVARGVAISGHVITHPWFDIGTRRKLLEANQHFLKPNAANDPEKRVLIKGSVQIEPGAKLNSVQLGPNVYVGANATIEDSSIRDALIMEGAIVRRSTISQSIVGAQSTVEGILSNAIVGKDTHILAEIPKVWLDQAGTV